LSQSAVYVYQNERETEQMPHNVYKIAPSLLNPRDIYTFGT